MNHFYSTNSTGKVHKKYPFWTHLDWKLVFILPAKATSLSFRNYDSFICCFVQLTLQIWQFAVIIFILVLRTEVLVDSPKNFVFFWLIHQYLCSALKQKFSQCTAKSATFAVKNCKKKLSKLLSLRDVFLQVH